MDAVTSMTIDINNNVYLCGGSAAYGGSAELIVIKINASSNIDWIKKYNQFASWGNDILVDNFGFVYVTGQSWINDNYDFITLKYNFAGTQQWVRFNGTVYYNDKAKFIDCDQTGHVFVCGYSDSGATIRTLKYDSWGNFLWLNIHPYGNFQSPCSFKVDSDGNSLILPGLVSGNSAVISKLNQNGSLIWSVSSINSPQNICIDNFNNVYLTGWSLTGGPSGLIGIRYDSSGHQKWYNKYIGSSYSTGKTIISDELGNIYIIGQAVFENNSNDVLTIKYSQVIGIVPINNRIPEQFALHQNYPNPFNPTTKISFSIPLSRGVSADGGRGVLVRLIIFDILGREVSTLVNETLSPGTYEVTWDGSGFASGVYFYSLITKDYLITNKMVILK